MPFYAFAWIACIASALIIIVSKLTSKYSIKNPWLFNFIWTFVIFIFTVFPALYYQAALPNDWPPIILAGIFAAGWNTLYILSMYKIDVTTFSPLFNFRLVFAIILGSVLFQEKLTFSQFVLFFTILIGGIFSSVDEKLNLKSFFKPSIAIGLLAMLFLAINNAFIKIALMKNGLWTANLWMSLITLLAITPTVVFFNKSVKNIGLKQLLPVLAMGILQMITNASANFAYSKNLGITSLIMAIPLSMIFVFILSMLLPKLLEKHTLKVYLIRFTAAAVMIYSAIKLSV
ncbi:DMT family transporter [Candidatus Roizmanbacteria bacterium]|nr:DMT family transporter [Candidatus Roizmanbacteria bacterium]